MCEIRRYIGAFVRGKYRFYYSTGCRHVTVDRYPRIEINFFTISSKVFLLYPDFSYRLTQILSTYLSRNILEEYFRFKKEHTPNTFIFKINTIISKLLSFVSLSFDRKNIRSESSRTVHTRNIYIYIYLSLAKIDRSLSAGLREFFEARCW